MVAIIEIMGHTLSFYGEDWISDDPAVARICERRAGYFVAHYYAEPVNDLAKDVSKSLKERVVQPEAKPERKGPSPENLAY
jgi:hypothetical protein